MKNKKNLKVLHVAAELSPIAKAGGVGDILGSLPKELAKKFNIDARVIIPFYPSIDTRKNPLSLMMRELKINSQEGDLKRISVWKSAAAETEIPVYLVENSKIFQPPGVKGKNLLYHFIFLTFAALEILKATDWYPDVIHLHDAKTGMIPKWLKVKFNNDIPLKNIATVLTIHNFQHQPIFQLGEVSQLGIKKKDAKKLIKLTKKNQINLMAEAIDNADEINTVSPTYAKEILTKKFGGGLSKLLRANKSKFTGILNGMDYSSFDPRTNDDTPVKYWIDSLDKKVENKLFLQKKFGLTQSPDLPLICVVSRLTPQKGLDLIEDVLKDLFDMGAQFVILGSGQEKIEKIFIKAEKKYPEAIEAEMEFDANMAQTIYAGADMMLMPSRFEPCGLSQIIAMRFGTLPIVRKTGGLADTVTDGRTGFVFNNYDKNSFLTALRRGVDLYYNDKRQWRKMQVNAMKKDFSWKSSAKKYIWLYKKAIRNHKIWLKEQEENVVKT